MTRNLPFEHAEWFYVVITIAMVIWFVFLWKERLKYPGFKFFVNGLIALMGITALTFLLLKPLKYSASKPFTAALITNNFNQSKLDSLKKNYANLVTYSYKPGTQLFNDKAIPESVFVLGHGIRAYDLWQLDSIKTTYLGDEDIEGIIQLSYKKEGDVGDNVFFKGRYSKPSKHSKLVLEGPAGRALDSVLLSGGDSQDFQLATNLNIAGKFVYQLVEKDTLNAISNSNPLPMVVSKKNGLRILVINDFPTFETKYLKNFLADKGHQLLIRSQLTKDRYKYEYFNMYSKPRIRLTQKGLGGFDLMLIDANSLRQLSKQQQNAIKASVKDDGLGVFIQPDPSFYTTKNGLARFSFNLDTNESVSLTESPRTKIKTYPYVFRNEASLKTIQTSNKKTVSAYKRLGLGRIGTSIWQNTFELQLDGQYEVYQKLWANSIERLSKKEALKAVWRSNSLFSFESEPFDFSLSTSIAFPNVLTYEGFQIPLRQHPDIASVWEGKTYPKNVGWKTLKVNQDSTVAFNYYVADSSKWKSLKAYQTVKDNTRKFMDSELLQKGSLKTAAPINLFYVWIVFVLCMGYLWLEPKL